MNMSVVSADVHKTHPHYSEYRHVPIDLYPLLRNYDVWGETVGINWNTKRWRYGEPEEDGQG